MVQATTPTFILTLPDTVDLSEVSHLYFTIEQNKTIVKKQDKDLTVNGQTVQVFLSQQETLRFKNGTANIQLNWTYENGSRGCSNIVPVHVDENLLKEVVE